jgi:hypothetical protein
VRTTLTLDDDVAAKLLAEARRSGEPFKQIVNRVLHTGLNVRSLAAAAPPFKVKARALGSKGFNYDKVWELIEQVEGHLHSAGKTSGPPDLSSRKGFSRS